MSAEIVQLRNSNVSKTTQMNEFLSELTKLIQNEEITNIVALVYKQGGEDLITFAVGDFKMNQLIGDIELLKDSILNDE